MDSNENVDQPASGAARPEEMVERPKRLRVLKSAHVFYDEGKISHPCVVRDISERGARLRFQNPVLLPERFWLEVELDAYKVECKMAWSHGLEMGVSFCGERIETKKVRIQVVRPTFGNINDDGTSKDGSEQDDSFRPRPRQGPVFGKKR
jgi:two-component system cell cycle response regulator